MTVKENLLLGAYPGKAWQDKQKRMEWVMELFPILKERAHMPSRLLSGGEQQMLTIGRGLMAQPRLLMVDEPSLGLAPVIQDHLYETLGKLRESKITILLPEQNALRALGIADRGYVMQDGKIVLEGNAASLMQSDLVKKAYWGGKRMEDYFSYTAKLFDPAAVNEKTEILKGIRVLDFSHVIFGPTATRLLAQYGAEVIKLELPYHGDLWRPATYWGKYWKHSNPLWHFVTQNKYFLGRGLEEARGQRDHLPAGRDGRCGGRELRRRNGRSLGGGIHPNQRNQPQDHLPELFHLRPVRAFAFLSGLGPSCPGCQRCIEPDRLSRYGQVLQTA